MFEKDLLFGTLLDYYGALLSERQRDALNFYYNDDLSLSEIADEMGISRQGVRDAIKRGEAELTELEAALGIAKSQSESKHEIEAIASMIVKIAKELPESEASEQLLSLSERIKALADN